MKRTAIIRRTPLRRIGKWAKRDRKMLKPAGMGTCEMCGEYRLLDNAHIVGRANKLLRYSPENLMKFCRRCHRYAHDHPAWFKEWFARLYPERQEYLSQKQFHN